METKCTIDGCEKPFYCKGWCRVHYTRAQRNGGPLVLRRQPPTPHLSKGYMVMQHKPVHVAIAEKALGRELRLEEIVHHADENKANNANNNLVICPDHTYHMLLHRRLRAYQTTGNPNLRKCVLCKKWDVPENLYFPPSQYSGKHKVCDAAAQSKRYLRSKLRPDGV